MNNNPIISCIPGNNCKILENNYKIFNNKGMDHIKTNEGNVIGNDLQCQYCKRIFTRKDNLNKHIKDRCKIKKKGDQGKGNQS